MIKIKNCQFLRICLRSWFRKKTCFWYLACKVIFAIRKRFCRKLHPERRELYKSFRLYMILHIVSTSLLTFQVCDTGRNKIFANYDKENFCLFVFWFNSILFVNNFQSVFEGFKNDNFVTLNVIRYLKCIMILNN